jgi:hypothetical protein
MTMRAESEHQPGQSRDPIIDMMHAHGIPITREAYIELAYMGAPPSEWTAENEADLPAELQDWSKVKTNS